MENRINKLFERKETKILSVYFTAGFPCLNDTMPILRSLQKRGIDMVEIGFPFSDPLADGPVIQASSHKAIQNGMTMDLMFSQLKDMRKEITMPVVLMGYINLVMHYGIEHFCKSCHACGVDGVILPDLPMKDYLVEYKPLMDKYGISAILLITPETSDERIRTIDDNTSSFIYMVSSAATTGAQKDFNAAKQAYFKKVNQMGLKNPRLVGFGVSNKATFDAACANSSGAIIGSRFIQCLETSDTIDAAVDMLLDGLEK